MTVDVPVSLELPAVAGGEAGGLLVGRDGAGVGGVRQPEQAEVELFLQPGRGGCVGGADVARELLEDHSDHDHRRCEITQFCRGGGTDRHRDRCDGPRDLPALGVGVGGVDRREHV